MNPITSSATNAGQELLLDFGSVGYHFCLEPFHVRLVATTLDELIAHAREAWRTYELFLIHRPGDCRAYIEVIPEAVPALVASRINEALKAGETGSPLPLDRFDRLFYYYGGDEIDPADEAWRDARHGKRIKGFVQALFSKVRDVQLELTGQGSQPLVRHVARLATQVTHPLDNIPRAEARVLGRIDASAPTHTPGFYQTLERCLEEPSIRTVAYRALGDFHVLRLLATAQRQRFDMAPGADPDETFRVSTLVERSVANLAWDSRIWFYSEGLGKGALFIEGPNEFGWSVRELVESGHRVPEYAILSTRDEGDLPGYSREEGDGWVLYRRIGTTARS